MDIVAKVIPHNQQRYETCGDWYYTKAYNKPEALNVLASRLGNEDYEFLIQMHEQIEAYLCRKRGISEKSITEFDIEFELNRKEGDTSEPGDAPDAPYKKEHFVATNIERILAAELGVDWREYEEAIYSLA